MGSIAEVAEISVLNTDISIYDPSYLSISEISHNFEGRQFLGVASAGSEVELPPVLSRIYDAPNTSERHRMSGSRVSWAHCRGASEGPTPGQRPRCLQYTFHTNYTKFTVISHMERAGALSMASHLIYQLGTAAT